MSEPDREPPIGGAILFLLAGPILWGAHLMSVYAFHAVICAIGNVATPTIVPAFVTLATAVTAGLLLVGFGAPGKAARILHLQPDEERNRIFLFPVARLLSGLSFAGVLWTGSAILTLQACEQLR
ncbi:hypothetical protein SO078_30610 (plasmid) [Sinorhizobium meliloti]|uniref:hypothetical protein n=1 Tax=Rhizobium meliloti TaxID=382 RepID=UPI002D7704F5|nr:hypothetical protein [Sinorhizobium meliloti]WRQ71880.1 hypothetical protein SO078_30610 [Sinorhizobium meliloti]